MANNLVNIALRVKVMLHKTARAETTETQLWLRVICQAIDDLADPRHCAAACYYLNGNFFEHAPLIGLNAHAVLGLLHQVRLLPQLEMQAQSAAA